MAELVENQQEEHDHIRLWINFAEELGIPENDLTSYGGTEKTRAAVSDLSRLMGTYEGGAAAMYAL